MLALYNVQKRLLIGQCFKIFKNLYYIGYKIFYYSKAEIIQYMNLI